jgi:hypothetical protein
MRDIMKRFFFGLFGVLGVFGVWGALAGPALAMEPTMGAAQRAEPAQQARVPRESPRSAAQMERLVEQMETACVSRRFSRAPRIDPSCPARMAAVVKRGEAAVPVLAGRLRALAAVEGGRFSMHDRGEVVASVLGKIEGRAATAAMLQLVSDGAVQKSRGGVWHDLHRGLAARAGTPVEGPARTPDERAALAQKWQAFWDARLQGTI